MEDEEKGSYCSVAWRPWSPSKIKYTKNIINHFKRIWCFDFCVYSSTFSDFPVWLTVSIFTFPFSVEWGFNDSRMEETCLLYLFPSFWLLFKMEISFNRILGINVNTFWLFIDFWDFVFVSISLSMFAFDRSFASIFEEDVIKIYSEKHCFSDEYIRQEES